VKLTPKWLLLGMENLLAPSITKYNTWITLGAEEGRQGVY
jgi:hypothetical protein